MKVYLIEPVNEKFRLIAQFSLGLMYIAAYLEKMGHIPSLSWISSDEELDLFLTLYEPDVIGITCGTPLVGITLKIAEEIKRRKPDIPIIVGGIHPTVRPIDLLKNKTIDYCCIGEGEYTMNEFCNALESGSSPNDIKGLAFLDKKNNLILTAPRPPIENLDSLPWPARHLVPNYRWMIKNRKTRGIWSKRSAMIFTSRGCPNRCIFCESHRIHGYKLRRRSPEDVIAEMKHLKSTYDIDLFKITDDTFTYPFPKVTLSDGRKISWIERWCELLEQENLNISFICQARANTINEELVIRFKKVGLKLLSFGFESGSDSVLKILKKGITTEQIRNTMKIVNKHGIKSQASFLFGIPGQKQSDIDQTELLLDEIKIKYIDFFIITPFPGTELEKLACDNKWIDKELKWDDYEVTDSVTIKVENFTPEEILGIKRKFQNKYVRKNIIESFNSFQAAGWAGGVVLRNIYILPKSLLQLLRTRGLHEFFISFMVNDRKVAYKKFIKKLKNRALPADVALNKNV